MLITFTLVIVIRDSTNSNGVFVLILADPVLLNLLITTTLYVLLIIIHLTVDS